jgi:hypothetical protein
LEAVEYDTALAGITWIARHRGVSAVWRLLHAMVRADIHAQNRIQNFVDPDQLQGRVLRWVVGVNSHQLARHAARLIVSRAE